MSAEAERPVAIVGAGAFGTALAAVLARRGRPVLLHTDDADLAREVETRRTHARRLQGVVLGPAVRATTSLAEAAREARLLVLAVPSTRLAPLARALGDVLDGAHLVVHAIGALAGDVRVSEVLRRETCVRRVGVLAGPALAADLAEGRSCSVVVASPFAEVTEAARAALGAPPELRVYRSADLVGVELASALSGALTVAVGLADGLGASDGLRATLVTRGLAEAGRLVRAAGGEERTVHGLAGLGNLLVRASSASARSDDHQLGLALGRGESPARRETEGARAAVAGLALARRLHVRAPLLEALVAVVAGGVPPARAMAPLVEHVADEE